MPAAATVVEADELSPADREALERSKRLRAAAYNRAREGFGGNVIGGQFSTGDRIEDMMLQRQGERAAALAGAEEALNEFAPRGADAIRVPRLRDPSPNAVVDYGGQRLAYKDGKVIGFSGGQRLAPEPDVQAGRFSPQGRSTFNTALTAALNAAGQNQMREYASQAMRERAASARAAPVVEEKITETIRPVEPVRIPTNRDMDIPRNRVPSMSDPAYVRSLMTRGGEEVPDRAASRLKAVENIRAAEKIARQIPALREQAAELERRLAGTEVIEMPNDGVPLAPIPLQLSTEEAAKAKKLLADVRQKIKDLEAKRVRTEQGKE